MLDEDSSSSTPRTPPRSPEKEMLLEVLASSTPIREGGVRRRSSRLLHFSPPSSPSNALLQIADGAQRLLTGQVLEGAALPSLPEVGIVLAQQMTNVDSALQSSQCVRPGNSEAGVTERNRNTSPPTPSPPFLSPGGGTRHPHCDTPSPLASTACPLAGSELPVKVPTEEATKPIEDNSGSAHHGAHALATHVNCSEFFSTRLASINFFKSKDYREQMQTMMKPTMQSDNVSQVLLLITNVFTF